MRYGLVLLALAFHLSACAGSPPSKLDHDALDTVPDTSRASIQMYIVLTDQAAAMGSPNDVQRMWGAVHGQDQRYRSIRSQVRWVPPGYEMDVELDFGRLPHPKLEPRFVESLVTRLPRDIRQRALEANTAVFMRSRIPILPDGNHIRLVGTAVLYAAEKFEGVILDLVSQRAWTAAQWREEIQRDGLSPRQVRIIRKKASDGTLTFQTLGLAKFGAPELVMANIEPGDVESAQRRFIRVLEVLKVQGGEAEQLLPDGLGRLSACSPNTSACVSLSD